MFGRGRCDTPSRAKPRPSLAFSKNTLIEDCRLSPCVGNITGDDERLKGSGSARGTSELVVGEVSVVEGMSMVGRVSVVEGGSSVLFWPPEEEDDCGMASYVRLAKFSLTT